MMQFSTVFGGFQQNMFYNKMFFHCNISSLRSQTFFFWVQHGQYFQHEHLFPKANYITKPLIRDMQMWCLGALCSSTFCVLLPVTWTTISACNLKGMSQFLKCISRTERRGGYEPRCKGVSFIILFLGTKQEQQGVWRAASTYKPRREQDSVNLLHFFS